MSEYERGWLAAREECAMVCYQLACPDAYQNPPRAGGWRAAPGREYYDKAAKAIRALSVAPQDDPTFNMQAAGAPSAAPTVAPQPTSVSLSGHVLMLRSLIARVPLSDLPKSPSLQAWYDEYKVVMATTDPTWLKESLDDDPLSTVAPSEVRVPRELSALLDGLDSLTATPPKAITYEDGWCIIDYVQNELLPKYKAMIAARGRG